MKQLNKCMAILLCVTLLSSMLMCVTPSQARYVNNVTWHGVYTSPEPELSSNRLAADGEMVALKAWDVTKENQREYKITIKSTADYMNAVMECASESEYLEASLDTTELEVGKAGVQVTLTLKLTEAGRALTEITSLNVSVRVRSQEDGTVLLYGYYMVSLYPIIYDIPDIEEEPTIPEETDPSEEDPTESSETTEPSNESTEPSSEATEPSGEATEPSSEATEPSGEATEPSNEPTQPSSAATEPTNETTSTPAESENENTVPTTEAANEPTESTAETSEPVELTSGTTEPGTNTPAEQSSQEAPLPTEPYTEVTEPDTEVESVSAERPTEIATSSSGSITEDVPTPVDTDAEAEMTEPAVEANVPEATPGATPAEDEDVTPTEIPSEPDNTPAEGDTGNSDEEEPSVEIPEEPYAPIGIVIKEDTDLEHFSWNDWLQLPLMLPEGTQYVELLYNGAMFPEGTRYRQADGSSVILGDEMAIYMYAEDVQEMDAQIRFDELQKADGMNSIRITVAAVNEIGLLAIQTVECKLTDVSQGSLIDGDASIIAQNGKLEIPYTWIQKKHSVNMYVERLVRDSSGQLQYVQHENQFGLTLEVQNKENEEVNEVVLTISNTEGKAPAGSYRVVIDLCEGETVRSTSELSFFIHYKDPESALK